MHSFWQKLLTTFHQYSTIIYFVALSIVVMILLLFWYQRNRYVYETRSHLATRAEQKFLALLHKIVDDDYVIHCQVSLAAMLNALNLRSARMIWAKRMDYVITDKHSRVICIIELDDASHARKDRRRRDKFINKILKGRHILVRFSMPQSKDSAFVKKTLNHALQSVE